jgi:RNA-binding protein YlmH
LLSNWSQVGKVPITLKEIDEEQLAVEPERIKEIKGTVASLRLDAVAAEGFGTSRSKMVREIKAERVKVNWKPVSNPALSISQGDVLSIRGRGRVVVSEVGGTTRKGRTSIVLHRYF